MTETIAHTWGRGADIVSVGHYQPHRVVNNHEIAKLVDTSDEWIQRRVGIVTRHFADHESVTDLAELAARDALSQGNVRATEVDLVIVATCSNLDRSPSTAGRVAERLGIPHAAVFDVNAACSGFMHALETAKQLLAGGSATTALVIGAEKMTDVTDWTDRSTCILVGDGAGAMVLRSAQRSSLSPVAWGSVPELTDAVRIEAPDVTFAQDGAAVFRWAITEAADKVRGVLSNAGLEPQQIAAFVPHQANLRLIEPLAAQLNFSPDTIVARDISESGNTSAASIPLALSKILKSGTLAQGAPILMFGFGGGFSHAGLVALAP